MKLAKNKVPFVNPSRNSIMPACITFSVLSKEVVLNVQKEVNAALEQMVPDVLKGETAFQVAKAKLTSLV